MNVVHRPTGAGAEDAVLRFSRGEISRKRAMALLGDISYSELLDRLAAQGLALPRMPAAELERMTQDVERLLAQAGR